jgi:hypothetical protein
MWGFAAGDTFVATGEFRGVFPHHSGWMDQMPPWGHVELL